MPTYRAGVSLRDDRGLLGRTSFRVTAADIGAGATAAASITDAVIAASNGAAASYSGILSGPQSADYGADAQYESSSQEAVLTFKSAAGQLSRLTVPAPKVTIFKADGITVDGADSLVGDISDAVLASGVTISGAALTTFVGGHLIQRRRKQLQSSLKTADLT
jgi:hypothetical protein